MLPRRSRPKSGEHMAPEALPPGVSGKAVEVLVRQKSFMGQVNDKLNLDAFQVPGHEGVGRATMRSDEFKIDQSAAHSWASPKGAPNAPLATAPTIKFRVAVLLIVVILVLGICGIMALPALSRMWRIIAESTENKENLLGDVTGAWAKDVMQAAIDSIEHAVELVNLGVTEQGTLASVSSVLAIRSFIEFSRFSSPSFDGHFDFARRNQAAAWNKSIGPGLSPAGAQAGTFVSQLGVSWSATNRAPAQSMSASRAGDEDARLDGVGISRQDDFQVFRLCNFVPSRPDCAQFPAKPDVSPPYPDFSKPQELGNDTLVHFNSPSYLSGVEDAGAWAVRDPLPGSPYLQIGYGSIVLCTAENCTGDIANAIASADLSPDRMSGYLAETVQEVLQAYSVTSPDDAKGFALFVVYNGLLKAAGGGLAANVSSTGVGSLLSVSDPGMFYANMTATPAVDSPNRLVRQASMLVREWLGGWGQAKQMGRAWGRTALVHMENRSDCSFERHKSTSTSSPPGEGCYFVSASKVNSLQGSARVHGAAEAEIGTPGSMFEMVTISVAPARVLLANLTAGIANMQAVVAKEFDDEADKWWKVTRMLLGITVALVVVVCCFSVWFSYRFGRSVLSLSEAMVTLQDLKFHMIDPRVFSHIAEINRMQRAYNSMCATIEVLAKFVPTAVVRDIVKNEHGKARRLHVIRKNVTILFSDIQGFTTISEALNQKDLLFFLTKYLSVMTQVVESYGGVVAEILGDGILAFWNTPDTVADHQAKACASALAQLQSMQVLNDEFRHILEGIGHKSFDIRIGIHTGKVLTGNIGSLTKMKFGCIGDAVNLASRLEGICKLYSANIICSQSTLSALPPNTFVTRELDLVQVKGKVMPVRIYELVGMSSKLAEERLPLRLSAKPVALLSGQSRISALLSFQGSRRSTGRASVRSPSRRLPGDKTRSSSDGSAEAVAPIAPSSPRWRPTFFSSALNTMSLASGQCGDDQDNDDEAGLGAAAGQSNIVHYGPVESFEGYQLTDIERYEFALHAYQEGDFSQAEEYIDSIMAKDAASDFLLERVVAAREEFGDMAPADSGWNGTLRLDHKEF